MLYDASCTGDVEFEPVGTWIYAPFEALMSDRCTIGDDIVPSSASSHAGMPETGGGGSVSSLSEVLVQPGSFGKSISESPSLSIESEH